MCERNNSIDIELDTNHNNPIHLIPSLPEVSASVEKESGLFADVFERVASHWPVGVAILEGRDGGGAPFRVTVSSFVQVSREPPLVSVCLGRDSSKVELLGPEAPVWIYRLEEKCGEAARAPGEARLELAKGGAVARLRGRVAQAVPAGDHVIIVMAIHEAAARPGRPLVYWRRAFWGLHVVHPFLRDEESLDQFIGQWHAGSLPKELWTHGAHVAARAYHAYGRGLAEAFATMKAGIAQFNEAIGGVNSATSGYHETLTQLWVAVVKFYLDGQRYGTRYEAVCGAMEQFGEDRDLHRLFYSFDVVRNLQARAGWVPPDREWTA